MEIADIGVLSLEAACSLLVFVIAAKKIQDEDQHVEWMLWG